mgnify:CR=1 FL=1
MSSEFKTKKKDSTLAKREAENLSSDTSSIIAKFPKNCLIELTNACNHACIFCTNPRQVRKIGRLDYQMFERFITDAVPLGLEEVGLYSTGEPFITKDIDKYVSFCKENGVKYVYITTNGALATEEKIKKCIDAGLNSIKFSVNAGTRETYKLIHGRDDFEKVVDIIRFTHQYREKNNISDLKIYASCVVTRFTEDEKENLEKEILAFVDQMAFYDVSPQAGQTLKYFDAMSLSKDAEDSYEPGPCAMLWNKIHLTREGYLSLCCIDYENSLTYADLNKESLKDAWNNTVIQEMRKRHQTQDLEGTLCHNCLYKEDKPVFPLTDIGREQDDLKNEVAFNKPKGVKNLMTTIDKLEESKK